MNIEPLSPEERLSGWFAFFVFILGGALALAILWTRFEW